MLDITTIRKYVNPDCKQCEGEGILNVGPTDSEACDCVIENKKLAEGESAFETNRDNQDE